MIINDPIYGAVKITEPVLVELIHSNALQRLKHIHQHGANYFFWPEADAMNRYDHSVGVMLLIRKLGGGVKQQIAGLLHDVGHSAFSHVLDYLLGNRAHEAHEHYVKQFITTTDIPAILKKHRYIADEIIDLNRYSILEQPPPALCADRLDYFLRDGLGYNVLAKRQVKAIVKSLTIRQGKIVTTDKAIAKLIGQTYLEMDREYWATSLNSLAINYVLVEMIRRAIGLGALSLNDLWKINDHQLVQYLKTLDDPLINQWFGVLHPETIVLEDKNQYDVHVYPKIRLIDPAVLGRQGIAALSQIDSEYAQSLAEAREFPEELFLRFHQ